MSNQQKPRQGRNQNRQNRPRQDQDKPLIVSFRGETYRLPSMDEGLDLDVAEAFENGKMITAIRGLLGEQQWAQLRAAGMRTINDLAPLTEQIARIYGFDGGAGESLASTD